MPLAVLTVPSNGFPSGFFYGRRSKWTSNTQCLRATDRLLGCECNEKSNSTLFRVQIIKKLNRHVNEKEKNNKLN